MSRDKKMYGQTLIEPNLIKKISANRIKAYDFLKIRRRVHFVVW